VSHEYYMKRALRLARRGRTSPNPMVGAVIVRDGAIVGEGFHPRAGDPHAEIYALKEAGNKARGATMYVTLEPCCHHGRTPPCTEAIIEAGISEVYVAMTDPDPRVDCNGLEKLKAAGVRGYCPVCEDEARALNEAYIKHRTTGMPVVVLKLAMSLDGKIATKTGDSKWITNERSRAYVHRLRSKVDAIIIGAGTARADNPKLTARMRNKVFYPIRVIVTRTGDLPFDLEMFREPGETYIACSDSSDAESLGILERIGARIIRLRSIGDRASIADLMRTLAGMGCLSVLIEGGSELAASALAEQVVDKITFFYAPKIIGGKEALGAIGGTGVETVSSSIELDRIKVRRFGDDIAIEGYIVHRTD